MADLYKASRTRAIPKWVGKIDRLKLMKLYQQRRVQNKLTSECWSGDHIVPLNSPLVCGLHWWANLQLMLIEENNVKANFFWPDMAEYTKEDLLELYRLNRKYCRRNNRKYKFEFMRYLK